MDVVQDTVDAFDHLIDWLSRDPDKEPIVVDGRDLYVLRPPGEYSAELHKRCARLAYMLDQLMADGFAPPADYVWRSFRDVMSTGCDFYHSLHRVDTEEQDRITRIVLAAKDDMVRRLQHEGSPPDSVRLNSNTPASNIAKVAGLIGSTRIEAVFDPFLDNQALVNLATLASFGGGLSRSCRLLTSKKCPDSGFVALWLKEHGLIGAEIKRTPDQQHRRFLLLDSGKTLVIGFSLNKFEHNETAHLASVPQDRMFFDAEWQKSKPL